MTILLARDSKDIQAEDTWRDERRKQTSRGSRSFDEDMAKLAILSENFGTPTAELVRRAIKHYIEYRKADLQVRPR